MEFNSRQLYSNGPKFGREKEQKTQDFFETLELGPERKEYDRDVLAGNFKNVTKR